MYILCANTTVNVGILRYNGRNVNSWPLGDSMEARLLFENLKPTRCNISLFA